LPDDSAARLFRDRIGVRARLQRGAPLHETEGLAGCTHCAGAGDLEVNGSAPNKKWEALFWGVAIAIFIFAGDVMIFTSHFHH
jgi:hypothetical protein